MKSASVCRKITCPGFTVSALTFGKGKRPLVILPGMAPTPLESYADDIIAGYSAFLPTHTVTVFDRRDDLPAGFSVPDMAEDTALEMELLGITDADVFGTSQGGMIAQVLAARHPELVHRMVLASAMPYCNPVAAETFSLWERLGNEGNADAVFSSMMERVYSPEYAARFADAFRVMRENITPLGVRRWGILARACFDFDARPLLSAVSCPVLVIGAGNDRVLSGGASEELAALLHAPLRMFPGAAHACFDEVPEVREAYFHFFTEEA